MLPTSGTFNFQSIQVELIIREAYERIGILGEFVEAQKLESAKRSIDFLLLSWMNKSINLWRLQSAYLPLVTSQAKYTLPIFVNNIIQANLRTSTRVLNGAPAASSGVAANAFDGNPLTACTQTATNGDISYDYGVGVLQQINFIGITSNTTQDYTIIIESSQDNMSWTPLLTLDKQTFNANVNVWFDVIAPIQARAYRIRETGGATFNIQELYFNNNILDIPISNISRYEYYTYPNKQLQSRPNTYYLARDIPPVLYIWPVPTIQYNCLQYTYEKMIEDVGMFYTNAVEIPSRFYPALVWGLSWQLALKFNAQIAEMLRNEYDQSFAIAAAEDTENVPINIYPDYNNRIGYL